MIIRRKSFMKKKMLLRSGLVVGIACVCACVCISMSAIECTQARAYAQELSEEPIEEETTPIEEIITNIEKTYEDIKNYQVAGTTIGVIAGVAVSILVSMIPSLINRSNIKKTLKQVENANSMLKQSKEISKKAQSEFVEVVSQYKETIKNLNLSSHDLALTKETLEEYVSEFKKLRAENSDLKEILLKIVANNPNLVGKGLSEEIVARYSKK